MTHKPIHFRAIILNHHLVYEDNERTQCKHIHFEAAEFFQWICDAVRECISELEAGTYNELINRELPK